MQVNLEPNLVLFNNQNRIRNLFLVSVRHRVQNQNHMVPTHGPKSEIFKTRLRVSRPHPRARTLRFNGPHVVSLPVRLKYDWSGLFHTKNLGAFEVL